MSSVVTCNPIRERFWWLLEELWVWQWQLRTFIQLLRLFTFSPLSRALVALLYGLDKELKFLLTQVLMSHNILLIMSHSLPVLRFNKYWLSICIILVSLSNISIWWKSIRILRMERKRLYKSNGQNDFIFNFGRSWFYR